LSSETAGAGRLRLRPRCQIYIDGFTGGQLPPSLDRRFVINSNPFHPSMTSWLWPHRDFHESRKRINSGVSSNVGECVGIQLQNPFNNLPPWHHCARLQPPQYSGNLVGPINTKMLRLFNIEGGNIGALNVVSATVLDPANRLAIVPKSCGCESARPNELESAGLIPVLAPNNTLPCRYHYFRDIVTNANVVIQSSERVRHARSEHPSGNGTPRSSERMHQRVAVPICFLPQRDPAAANRGPVALSER